MVKIPTRLFPGVLVCALHLLIYPVCTFAMLNKATESNDLIARIPCLEGGHQATHDSKTTSSEACSSGVDIGQSLSTYFGHIRGEQALISGNYDGFNMAYQANDEIALKAFAGYPDLTSDTDFDPYRYLYGVETQFSNMTKEWEYTNYFIGQHGGTSVSGRLFGMSVHYSQPTYSYLGLVEYDLDSNSYAGLSTTGAWKVRPDTTISASLDLRHLPMQMRQRSYLKKIMTDTNGWSWNLPDDRINQLSLKHSNAVTGMSMSIFQGLSRRFKINGSYSVLSTSQMRSTAADDEPLNEHYYHFILSGYDWITLGDQNRIDISYKMSARLHKTTAVFDAKYPLSNFWNIQPRIYTERLNDIVNNDVIVTTSSTLTMILKSANDGGLRINAGGKWETDRLSAKQDESFSYYVSLDYQTTF